MKIVCTDKIINLDKFEAVSYRASLWGDGYPVEATKNITSGGLFGGITTATEEIARATSEQHAKQLVADIADAWVNGQNVFNVNEWAKK